MIQRVLFSMLSKYSTRCQFCSTVIHSQHTPVVREQLQFWRDKWSLGWSWWHCTTFWEKAPCNGLVNKSATMSSVGQYTIRVHPAGEGTSSMASSASVGRFVISICRVNLPFTIGTGQTANGASFHHHLSAIGQPRLASTTVQPLSGVIDSRLLSSAQHVIGIEEPLVEDSVIFLSIHTSQFV